MLGCEEKPYLRVKEGQILTPDNFLRGWEGKAEDTPPKFARRVKCEIYLLKIANSHQIAHLAAQVL